MKAAVVNSFDKPPIYGEFAAPVLAPDQIIVKVQAAAISRLVKGQASGSHYSSGGQFPFVPGIDGVGTLETGELVYFGFPKFPFGSMAEYASVKPINLVHLPRGLNPVKAAALANPGMSSWAALTRRAKMVPGEVVLINGATGVSGSLAIQIAKTLGAARVIVTGRTMAKLEVLRELGADILVPLEESPETLVDRFRDVISTEGVGVVLDYLWGDSALAILNAISGHGSEMGEPRIRYVQVGAISSPKLELPASILRSSGLELLGSGLGSVPVPELVAAIGEMLNASATTDFRIETSAVPLSQVESAWDSDLSERVVFTP